MKCLKYKLKANKFLIFIDKFEFWGSVGVTNGWYTFAAINTTPFSYEIIVRQ